MHFVPPNITDNIMKIYHKIGGKSISYVDIIPEAHSLEFDCHNNCEISKYERVTGFYIVMDMSVGCYNLVKHSVVRKNSELIDITPSKVKKHLFIECNINILNYKFYSYLEGYLYMNYTEMKNLEETLNDYYVYALIDPRKDEIFYIGKGCKNRWLQHMDKKTLDDNSHKSNKIKKIHEDGLIVGVKFLEKNIIDETTAYKIEEQYIKKYGRIKDGGILTNVCLNSNPPNHKGKTYEEIYGIEKAKDQKQKRSKIQQAAGGYGPQKHTEETKEKIRAIMSGKNNPMYGVSHTEETKKKISESNLGRKHSDDVNKSKGRSGELNGNFGPQEKINCPHCDKSGGKGIMKRWHFDNCKEFKY